MTVRASGPTDRAPGLQEQIESCRPGRALIGAFVAVTVASMVLTSLPAPAAARRMAAVVAPWARITGLTQDWDMFAPDPARRTLYVSARIAYSDGSVTDWRPPDGDRVLGAYRDYRWRRLATFLQDDTYQDNVWPEFARWLADTHAGDGRRPVAVTLVRDWAPTPAPGGGGLVRWYSEPYFTLELAR